MSGHNWGFQKFKLSDRLICLILLRKFPVRSKFNMSELYIFLKFYLSLEHLAYFRILCLVMNVKIRPFTKVNQIRRAIMKTLVCIASTFCLYISGILWYFARVGRYLQQCGRRSRSSRESNGRNVYLLLGNIRH